MNANAVPAGGEHDPAVFHCAVAPDDHLTSELFGDIYVCVTVCTDEGVNNVMLTAAIARALAVRLIEQADRIDGKFTTLIPGLFDGAGDLDAP